mgnify:FL=1
MSARNPNAIPRVLQTYNVDAAPINQRLETEILYPVVKSQSSCRFVFRPTGILDSNSKLQMSLLMSDANEHFLPVSTGVASLVKNAYLEIGGKRISSVRDFGFWKTWKNLQFTNDYKLDIGLPREGLCDVLEGAWAAGSTDTSLTAKGQLKNVYDNVPAQYRPTSANTPRFMLTLGDLIPCLKNFRLPLFAISQEVALIIEWQPDTKNLRYCSANGVGAATSTIVEADLLIVADYLFYPNLMEQLAMEMSAGDGMDQYFYDVLVSHHHEPGVTNDPGNTGQSSVRNFSHQIQVGGQRVRSIVAQFAKGTAATGVGGVSVSNGVNETMGVYVSNTFQNGDTYNLHINNVPFYSLDIENESLAYTETSKALGAHMNICNNQWTMKNIRGYGSANGVDGKGNIIVGTNADYSLSADTFCGANGQDIVASKRWLGVKLSNIRGEAMPVSNLPILFKHNYAVQGGNAAQGGNLEWQQATNLRFFAEVSRVLNIRGGVAQLINV